MAFELLNVTLGETDIVRGDKAHNIATIDSLMSGTPLQSDLLVLPELFSTGFVDTPQQAAELAERNTEHTMRAVHELAQKHSSAVCGSYLAHTAGMIFNRLFFMEPSGDETFYDKRHLFTMGGEKQVFTSGSLKSPIIRYRGWNIKPIVCYDLRFPVFCRNVNNEYDVLVVVANWPKARLHAWKSLLIARAIENCCYVLGVNRCGVDDKGLDFGSGSSMIIDYKGKIVAQTLADKCMVSASLSMGELNEFRRKFPVWRDADEFMLK